MAGTSAGKSYASPVYRNGSGDRKRRRQSSSRRLRELVCVVERRRACARVSSANGTRSHAARVDGFAACRLAVRITYERKRPAALRSPGIFGGPMP